MAEDRAIFRLDGIVKRYGSAVALDQVTLAVEHNEYVSLLGPSGSGKTVLLRTIAGFEAPDAGRVYLAGRDITRLPPHERGIGFVFQNFALFPHMTVLDNVAFGLSHGRGKVSAGEARQRAQASIALVGLDGLEGRGINQISGGQKQRVALARTLVTEPKLILLDEPLGALDANLRGRMRSELRAIRERLGVTFLHVTGSETEALAMGDRVIVLDRGRIAQFGRPDDVYGAPASANVAKFLNRYNILTGRLDNGMFASAFGRLAYGRHIAAEQPAYAIRYDRVVPEASSSIGERPAVPAVYLANEYLGSSIMYFFETAEKQIFEVEHHLSNGAPQTFAAGETYRLTWRPEDAIAFG